MSTVIGVADKVTVKQAEEAFNAGRRVMVTERPEGLIRPVWAGETTNRRTDTYSWEMLAESVRVWQSRYPRQTFYVVRES